MGDSLGTIVAIGIAAVLMFVFPVMTMADRTDDVSQLTVQTETTEFVDEIRTTGKITPERYDRFIQAINSTGNLYDVEIEIKVLDENHGKKSVQVQRDKLGENYYFEVFNSQVMEKIDKNESYLLKEGDIVAVKVKNTSQTISQQFKNFFYTVIGNDTYTIAADHGGIVTATGKQ
mgnify:FL=1